ncbi:glycerophosphodiester phosphodiesterase family protein [Plastoroseomonas arctica]|uniref:Glycerophosphodiester phosphodiesterase n=1 Tax=Plastoroseomonas arctica TaxID=1509237 RepID=A0AAF1K0W2_9PROT|nr:glycerophosphodiester phosphodiesterase family protein [Plastoroseomonas arctica]MBR0656978.1 glycerophosphodiester phosphodiesterase [Plastoroseomonas arctica]
MQDRPDIISHRGGALLWAENSLRAFIGSRDLAVDETECDVHLSADGEVVIIHDATLDRMSEARGPVAAHSMATLRAIALKGADAGTIPALADLAALYRDGGPRLRIEIKTDAAGHPYPGIVAKTLAVIDGAGLRGRSVLIGFQAPAMAEALAAGGLHGVSWLVDRRTLRDIGIEGVVATAAVHGFHDIGFSAETLDVALVAHLAEAGLAVNAWGANDEAQIRRMLALGIVGFATDDPRLALALRGGAGGMGEGGIAVNA